MNNLKMVTSNKFELHYFFSDKGHTMDAVTRHKCEGEILSIISEIAELLEIEIKTETEAYAEGGLKEIWQIVSKNQFLIGIITGILINVLSDYLTKDNELTELQKDELKLEIQYHKLNIKKLEQELNENPNDEVNLKEIEKDTSQYLNNNQKIIKHKSNFYKNVNSYVRVIQITTNSLTNENLPTEPPKVILRKDFVNFIKETDELEPILDENASIEIISPVLKKGKYKWRGIYNDAVIDFYMNDILFKNSIFNQEVTFKNGICINCVLQVSRKLNEIGEEYISSYSVLTVLSYVEKEIFVETSQGKKYKRDNEFRDDQINLF